MAFIEVKIVNDTFSPFVKDLKSRVSGSQMSGFMKSQENVLYNNVTRSFKEQIYGTDSTENKWVDLKNSTVKRREKRGTWRGMSGSILKETFVFLHEMRRHFKSGKDSDGYYAKLQAPSIVHTSAGGSKISTNKLAEIHQYGYGKIPARPPYSFLMETRDKLVNNFLNYFWK
jgi:hypothetical protein